MRPEWFDIAQVIGDLEGTTQSIDDCLPEGMIYEDLTAADHTAIDAAIFECEVCGWWVSRDDESEHAADTCQDCGGEED